MVDAAAINRVADRYLIRLAARKACDTPAFHRRQASLFDFTPEVLEIMAAEFYLPMHEGKVAFGSLVKRFKQLTQVFTKVPQLWGQFKKTIGVESLADIPAALKGLAKRGYNALKTSLQMIFDTWPLKLYTLDKGKLSGISKLIEQLSKRHPEFKHWLDAKVKPRVNQFDMWLREKSPVLSKIVLVAVFFWIWFNVVEFEWDLKSLTDVLVGNLTLADLLDSLPGSAIGFLLKVFRIGSLTLLPATIAARLLYLIWHRYVVWTGSGFRVDWELLSDDIGVPAAELQET